jgi:hypothetical protein
MTEPADDEYEYESGESESDDADIAVDGQSGQQNVQCPTCGRLIAQAHFDLHTAFCARNNVRCDHPGCGKVVRRVDLPQHRLDNHARVACECGAMMEASAVAAHHESECPCRKTVRAFARRAFVLCMWVLCVRVLCVCGDSCGRCEHVRRRYKNECVYMVCVVCILVLCVECALCAHPGSVSWAW